MDTQISLAPDLKAKVEREARARGMSLAEFVRETLEGAISQKTPDDSLLGDTAVFQDHGPVDYSSRHDDYLYGDRS